MTATASVVLEETATAELALRRDLAACYRLIAHFRMTDLIANHISVRVPGPEHHFLLNPYGLLYEEITASNLVKVDLDGELVGASEYGVNPAGFVIHSAIHAAREDAQCILHTHTKAGCAVAAQKEGLLPLNQASLEFYNRVAYHDYEGLAVNLDERERLVEDLGSFDVMILRNHGLLALGDSIKRAFHRIFYLERACEIQIAAQAAELVMPSPEICEYTCQQWNEPASVGSEFDDSETIDLTWAAMIRLVERLYPDYKD